MSKAVLQRDGWHQRASWAQLATSAAAAVAQASQTAMATGRLKGAGTPIHISGCSPNSQR